MQSVNQKPVCITLQSTKRSNLKEENFFESLITSYTMKSLIIFVVHWWCLVTNLKFVV